MRIERLGLVLSLGLTVTAAACGSVLQAPDGGVACHDLGEDACRSRSDCAVNGCAPCSGGGSGFINCYDPRSESPVFCGPCPPPCSSLTEDLCKATPGCRANTCTTCGGAPYFAGCVDEGAPAGCILIAIPCPLSCAEVTTQEACEARGDCHPVFVDGRDCQCAALGCCARFSRCADGATAVCKEPPIVCDAVAPFCEGPYVVAYSGGCYEGCALASDCAPVSSP
jgi:hypothetical protein